jgi:hypothetical protein
MLNCDSWTVAGRRFSSSLSAIKPHPAESTPTRTDDTSSAANEYWPRSCKMASIGPCSYRQQPCVLMLVRSSAVGALKDLESRLGRVAGEKPVRPVDGLERGLVAEVRQQRNLEAG